MIDESRIMGMTGLNIRIAVYILVSKVAKYVQSDSLDKVKR